MPRRKWYPMVKWVPDSQPGAIKACRTRKSAEDVLLPAYEPYLMVGLAWIQGPFPQEILDIQREWLALSADVRDWLFRDTQPRSFYIALMWCGALGNPGMLPTTWKLVDGLHRSNLSERAPELYRAVVHFYARMVLKTPE